MADYEFTLPLAILLPRVNVPNKRFSVDLNTFRAAHHRTYTDAKKHYKKIVSPQFSGMEIRGGKVSIHYDFYAGSKRALDLDNFVGAAKKFFQDAMVESGFIEDDSVKFIVFNSERFCGVDKDNPRIVAKVTVLDN